MKKYILALDQGTTSSRAIIFREDGTPVHTVQREFTQYFPKNGWVEHDAMEILSTELGAARECMLYIGADASDVSCIGITNQRETVVMWDKQTGEPVYHAIVWQCRRTAEYCDELLREGMGEMIKSRTGLLPDAYFSATKIKWLLDNIAGLRGRAERGEILVGTVDTWLLWNLTSGKVFATDVTNASRTMLYNIHKMEWDDELLRFFGIPSCILPRVMPSSGIFGCADAKFFGSEIPISGIAGDQQSALFGQACIETGDVKNTYGTGAFLLMNTGNRPVASRSGLLTTVAWQIGKETTYALEGSVFVCGSVIQWLRDELKIIDSAAETEEIAKSVTSTDGVYLVPAFVGLGAPYWDPYARGALLGVSRGTSRAHIVRAALEGIAFETCDVLSAMENDVGVRIHSLAVDGGASANNFLMQTQADFAGVKILRPVCTESTALGAAMLAALGVGIYYTPSEIAAHHKVEREFSPEITTEARELALSGWHDAVNRVLKR